MSQRGEQGLWYAPVLTGGLERKAPPHRLDPSMSPDLDNVTLSDFTVKKRGGFVPLSKHRAKRSALRNRGYHSRSKVFSTGDETDYLIVPGMMIAGHRTDYDNLEEFCIEFFCTIADLTKEHGGDSQQAGIFGGAPYRLSIRPIISKGPVKKTLWDSSVWTTAHTQAPGGMDWEWPPGTAAGRFYGVSGASTNPGMPFCLYLWQSTIDDEWRFNFSVNGVAGTDYILPSLQSSLIVEVGPIYHVIASCRFDDLMALKVGIWDEEFGAFQYEPGNPAGAGKYVTQTMSGVARAGGSPTPIQLFDCPQPFIENPTGAQPLSGNVPTGWGYNAANGGYFFRSKRFEGTIDDLVIWRQAIADEDDTLFDRRLQKIDLDVVDQDAIVNYWDFTKGDYDVVEERLGKGNHFYPSPAPPVTTALVGGRGSDRPTAWYFNGMTSYAMPNLWRHPSWRLTDVLVPGSSVQERAFLRQVLDEELGLGLAASFRCDSVAEPFNQVVAEIHGVMQLSVNPSGRIQGMCRGNGGGALSPVYSSPVQSSFVIEAGTRYEVALFWGIPTDGNRPLTLFINGQVEATISVPRDQTAGPVYHASQKYPPGAFTIGMGARHWASHTDKPNGDADDLTGDENTAMMDSRSGFVGVIEDVKILDGSYPPSAASLLEQQDRKDQGRDDWTIKQPKLWVAPQNETNRDVVSTWALDLTAKLGTSATTGGGHALRLSSWNKNREEPQLYAQEGDGTGHVIHPRLLQAGEGGVDGPGYNGFTYGIAALQAGRLTHVYMETFWVLGRWLLGAWSEQIARSGCWHFGQEARPPDTTPQKRRDWLHGVFEQNVYDQLEDTGNLGRFVFKRCKEPDVISEIFEASWATLGFTVPSPTQIAYGATFHAQRPYGFHDPDELAPTWVEGLAIPPPLDNEIALVHHFKQMRSREDVVIAAAARNLYWVKPPWRQESPFDEPTAAALWAAGAPGDYVRFGASPGNAAYAALDDDSFAGDWSLLHFECWLMPHKLDGFRLVAAKGDYRAQTWNYVIGFLEGALSVAGTLAGGAWQYREIQGAGLGSLLKPNAWNHLWVRMGRDGVASASVQAWINGEPTKLSVVSGYTALDGGGTPDATTGGLYLLGLPRGRERIETGVETIVTLPWCGLCTEFRQLWDDEAPVSPTGPHPPSSTVGIVVPWRRYADDADPTMAVYHAHLNLTYGWRLQNVAPYRPPSTIGNPDNGIVQLRQMIPIAEGAIKLRDATGWPYRATSLRDRVYLTNGRQDALELKFTKWSDPDGPFRLWRMGMEIGKRAQHAPIALLYSAVDAVLNQPLPTDWLQEGIYAVWVSFLDEDGRESDPLAITAAFSIQPETRSIDQVANSGGLARVRVTTALPAGIPNNRNFHVVVSGTGGAPPTGYDGNWNAAKIDATHFDLLTAFTSDKTGTATIYADGIRITGLPRSNQQQCIGRRIYFSASGGGLPLWHSDLRDNVSQMAEIWGGGTGFQAPEPGRRLVPGRARLIAAGQGSIVLANFPAQESGGNVVMVSDPEEPTYFSLELRVRIDSRTGDSILGLVAHRGFYVMKRSSTWLLDLRTGGLNSSDAGDGAGAGGVVHERRIIGADERGVQVFAETGAVYASASIEPIWRTLPLRDVDLLRMHGASHRAQSQYMLSVRLPGDVRNKTILVLETGIGDRQAWSRLTVPEHSYLAAILDPVTERPRIAIGTTNGRVLILDSSIFSDHHDSGISWINNNPDLYDGTVDGTQTGLIQTLSGISQGFYDVAGDGLRGMPIYLIYTDVDSVEWRVERTIVHNDAFSLTWDGPLPGSWPVAPPFTLPVRLQIGGYDAHWSSGWIGDGRPGEFIQLKEIYVEHEPSVCTLTVQNEAALGDRAAKGIFGHPSTRDLPEDPESRTIALRSGVQLEPIAVKQKPHGRYGRIVLRTGRAFATGLANPWSVSSVGVSYAGATLRGQPR